MFIWKHYFKRVGPFLSFVLLLTACAGAGKVRPLPTPEPTVVPADEAPEEDGSEAAVVPANELPEETDQTPTRIPADKYADLEIVTLLPRDAIPAVDNPQFLLTAEADDFYDPNELVIGVEFDGDARAYSIPYLSNREIVNDTVGGVKIAVTW